MKQTVFLIIFIVILQSCNPYIPRTPYISEITKAKEIELGGGPSFHFIYMGVYGNLGYGISNFLSVHGSGDYTITGVHLDGKIRLHKKFNKIHLNTEFGYGWNYSSPLNLSFGGRWYEGNYQCYSNQTYIRFNGERNIFTIGSKYGILKPKYLWSFKGDEVTIFNKIINIIEPFIHYSLPIENPTFGKKMHMQISYSNAYLTFLKGENRESRMFSDILGTLSVGTQIIF